MPVDRICCSRDNFVFIDNISHTLYAPSTVDVSMEYDEAWYVQCIFYLIIDNDDYDDDDHHHN